MDIQHEPGPPGFEGYCLVVGMHINGAVQVYGHDHIEDEDVVALCRAMVLRYALEHSMPTLPPEDVATVDQWLAAGRQACDLIVADLVESLRSGVSPEMLANEVGQAATTMGARRAATAVAVFAVNAARLRKGSGES